MTIKINIDIKIIITIKHTNKTTDRRQQTIASLALCGTGGTGGAIRCCFGKGWPPLPRIAAHCVRGSGPGGDWRLVFVLNSLGRDGGGGEGDGEEEVGKWVVGEGVAWKRGKGWGFTVRCSRDSKFLSS